MNKTLSRGPSIDIEKCIANSGNNRFDLVIMAAARAKELARRHKNSESTEYTYTPITALLEFQEGKLGHEYLKRIK
jgi:DNA-directed RNA polymerase subunit K/omega